METDQARALLAAIVAGSDDAIVSKTLDGIIRSWNAGAERIFGWSADEAVGQSINIIIPPELRHEEKTILAKLARGERIDHFETERVRKDGRRVDISLTISPVRDESGRILGASKVARDVTDRKRIEAARRESEAKFRALADNIAQLVWMADGDGSATWFNKRWLDFTGTTEADNVGWGWRGVVHPDHAQRVVAKLRSCFQAGQQWEDTFPLRASDGTYRWFLSRAMPIRDPSGHLERWFCTHTDITAEREAEQRLREADRRKDEFLAMLGHELRNPLASILAATELLKISLEGEPRVQRAFTVLERQTNQITRLIDGLLEVSRIARGKIQLDRSVIDLREVLQDVMHDRGEELRRSELEVELDLPSEPLWTWGDPARLMQVIENLVGNAIKFTPGPGSIRIALLVEEGDAVIRIRDSGVGIRAELLHRMFEPFQQDTQDIARTGGGLGLGLALCKGLVELHAGSIEAHSEGPGTGAEFEVRLPRSAPPVSASADASEVSAPPRRVLIVEDNPDAAQMLHDLLELKGHQVCVAQTGAEALEVLRNDKLDIVLCDLGLPVMNGYELAREIRRDPKLADLPLIAVTGYGQPEDQQRTAEAGFDEHLTKPVDLQALDRALAHAAATHSASS